MPSNALPVGVSPSFPLFFIIHFPTGVSAGWKEFFVVVFLCFFSWFKKWIIRSIPTQIPVKKAEFRKKVNL
ncbi:hypothetical protein [Proteiniphilum propionicum]|uniref:hypothetical protein n=1 Tax=Proteiniphilum propionicum TaxID=2829812 RepID=UPI001EEAB9BD|nr:hypothetical protein [Proteiniphilum propionicum]ULB34423.1 hypothetical protein KDN43_15975 [Proteiniphilum propionicum]